MFDWWVHWLAGKALGNLPSPPRLRCNKFSVRFQVIQNAGQQTRRLEARPFCTMYQCYAWVVACQLNKSTFCFFSFVIEQMRRSYETLTWDKIGPYWILLNRHWTCFSMFLVELVWTGFGEQLGFLFARKIATGIQQNGLNITPTKNESEQLIVNRQDFFRVNVQT